MENKIKSASQLEVRVILTLSEKEARALEALTKYGAKVFIETFYEKLGRDYLTPYSEGIESLFQTIKDELPKHLDKADRENIKHENRI